MNKSKKIISLVLSVLLVFSCFAVTASAVDRQDTYEITNPYDGIDWDNWKAYKTQLHSHTNASDGFETIHEYVQDYYDRDYDIVALTDHATNNLGWNKMPQIVPIIRLVKYERTKLAPITPLTDEEYDSYLSGTASSTTRTHENGMLDVPMGIELNGATPKCDCHLTGYFCNYGQGLIGVYGDYETPSAGVNAAGGLSMLSHVGEYVYQDHTSDQYVGQPVDAYYANKFAQIFMQNQGSSMGMGINSADDENTRCDRILYDEILQRTIPNGVVPWGFCFSDSHSEDDVNRSFTMNYMESLTMDNFKDSMTSGHFFSVSHYSNGVELDGIAEMPEDFDNTEGKAAAEDMDTPLVTRVTVKDNTITIEGTDFNRIVWVSDGQVIKRQSGITDGTATIDLNSDDLTQTPNLYVRFYITGRSGICYSQPFTIHKNGETFKYVEIPETNDQSTSLRKLVTILDKIFFKHDFFTQLFKKVVLGYSDWGFLNNA